MMGDRVTNEEIMAYAKQFCVQHIGREIHIVFLCPTDEEARLTFAALEERMERPDAQTFTIRIGKRTSA